MKVMKGIPSITFMVVQLLLSVRAFVDPSAVALLRFHALLEPRSCGFSCVADPMPTDTTQLYATMDRLLRRAERSPSVRALSKQWLTMPPEELVENALVIGSKLVGSFSEGCRLLGQAEEYAGLMLSPRAYAALMRMG